MLSFVGRSLSDYSRLCQVLPVFFSLAKLSNSDEMNESVFQHHPGTVKGGTS